VGQQWRCIQMLVGVGWVCRTTEPNIRGVNALVKMLDTDVPREKNPQYHAGGKDQSNQYSSAPVGRSSRHGSALGTGRNVRRLCPFCRVVPRSALPFVISSFPQSSDLPNELL
jgi:hypothetical protein